MAKTNVIAEPGKQEIIITRIVNAPRDLVFKAYTDPNAIPQWWGPRNLTTVVDQMDVRPGGIWRFVHRDAEGNEYGFHGVYHDVVSPDRIVSTFEFEGVPGHVLLATMTFEEQDGKTKLTDASVFQSVEDRDGMLQSGMEGGASESMDRLDEYLAKA
ncbi:MAG TPA: SRPBCC family protein [Chloroflexia bacterium]|nr:SRPBCC family protein [Chloroflexia bacterium]